ncbi:MAG: DUF4329 domain-containing protein [Treponema sp.]|jgi:RHS repeat-associated protein|nr:DUF4329 domain-containing protein [Treponema sp.]
MIETKRSIPSGKELDEETGLYYYGARYLDPKTSHWLSTDPAMGEYIPGAPVNDEIRKQNQNLPGMGGVFNIVNLHTYHYAGNNPVKYTDPTGMWILNSDESYTAEKGDTLWGLAEQITGEGQNWKNYGYTEEQAKKLKPGDVVNPLVFDSADDAAISWGNRYLELSRFVDCEFGSTIYEINTPDGSMKYSYTDINIGSAHKVFPFLYKDLAKIESYIHTHGEESGPGYDDENFSSVDIKIANSLKMNGYLVTPSGRIKKYCRYHDFYKDVIDIDPSRGPRR